jgi:hypothetical protein
VRSLVHVKLSSKVKELAPKVPMRLNECNARKIYEIPRATACRAGAMHRIFYSAHLGEILFFLALLREALEAAA